MERQLEPQRMQWWRNTTAFIIAGFIIGLALGWQVPSVAIHLSVLGDIFLRLLKMLIPFLVFLSIAAGIISIGDVARLSRLGALTIAYYLLTNALAVTVGLTLVNIIQPGVGVEHKPAPLQPAQLQTVTLRDILLSFIPPNVFEALSKGAVLPLIFLALVTGFAVLAVGERAEPVHKLIDAGFALTMKIVEWVMWVAPIGILGLSAGLVARASVETFIALGKYAATVIIGLLVHGCVVLPLLLWWARRSVISYIGRFTPALVTAFSTSSSSATLPVTLKCASDANVNLQVRQFVLPLGATVNMDGTALYEAVAAMFVAQLYGISPRLTGQLLIFITANLAAIGAAGIPSAGLVTMAIVFQTVGLPLDAIGLLLPIDRFLDMFRTTVNVWGDAVGCSVVQRWYNARRELT